MKIQYSLFAFIITISCFSQTKLIAFKSHSGNSENFTKAVSEDLFDANFSNLGVVPQQFVLDAKLDSVIILNENESILVTSSSKKLVPNRKDSRKVWTSGRETVHNPLFSRKNIDSVKQVLKRDYFFVNDIDSVVFVEYDKKSKTYKPIRPTAVKPVKEKSEKTPKGLLFGVLMISGISGLYSWKKNKKK
ncbi:hypothetical protein [Chryseobacterium indologenes]|uniref:LPXTG cell wall anchor domain-containing protein n=1 Tax=Chryseobacterium indologenes TaxID=253 RepID=A0A0N0IWV1_CHRID|nr:hypothetical protein [Chryseobacterium indologenes]KPE51672.1 hypothetical protein AOB46_08450 [Chryseobacterium indologenes]